MDRLPRDSELYARYVKTLTNQEDELVALRKTIQDLRKKETLQQKTLEEYLMSLEIS